MAKETKISIILLMGMFISVCVVSWYGIASDIRGQFVKTNGEAMAKSPVYRALADGQMSALELTAMADDSFDFFAEYNKFSPQRQAFIDTEYEKYYGMSYPAFFGCYVVSLFSVALLLLMLLIRLIGRCRGHKSAGWELAVLSAVSMSYFFVCANATENPPAQFDCGGFITLALAIASSVFWKIAHLKNE